VLNFEMVFDSVFSIIASMLLAVAQVQCPSQSSMKLAADYSKSFQGQTVVVMFDGKVVFEQYDNRGSENTVQMLASGSKSFVGIAAAASLQDGIIKLDDKVCESITEWRDDTIKSEITYRQLLTLTSGLTAGERGKAVRAPTWKEIAAKPMSGQPGRQFEYGAYHLNTFALALEQKLGSETFDATENGRTNN